MKTVVIKTPRNSPSHYERCTDWEVRLYLVGEGVRRSLVAVYPLAYSECVRGLGQRRELVL